MNYDITFCSRKCNNEKCERNLNYVDKVSLFETKPFISMASFDNCEEFLDKEIKRKYVRRVV